MNDPIRVLHYIGSLNPGGSQSMVMNIYRNIDRNKIQFDFVVDRKDDLLYKKEIESLGGKVYVFDEYFKGYNYLRFTKQWKQLFKKHPEYKIIHCHVRSVASIVLKIAKRNGLRTICHSHNTSNGRGLKAIVKKILQGKIKKHCDYYFACSEESAKWLYGDEILKNDNCLIVNNAIDTSKYIFNEGVRNRLRKNLKLEDKIVLGQVGRIEMVKNYDFSLNLLRELLLDDNRYYLLIVGTGPMKDEIIKKAKELRIDKNIMILEKRNDVNELMQAMDIFIMPSLYEGLPFALVEAQAASLPCVISNNIKDGIIDEKIVVKRNIKYIEEWKKEIINKTQGISRKDNSIIISKSGFGIEENVRKISDFYCDLARLKIFFCLGSMNRGGAERVVANLSNYFIGDNDVSIIVTKQWKPEYNLNESIGYFVLDNEVNNKSFLSRTLCRIKKLRIILKTESPDIVIAFLPEPSFRLMVAKSFLPVKTIVSERNDPNIEYDSIIKRLLARILYSRADGFVFQTPDAKKWFSKKIQNKSVVIPNPIDEKFLCIPYTGEREKTIVTVGRLVEQKNQKLLINAFYAFHRIHKDYRLKIYGEGPLRNDLQKQIKELNLIESVALMGEVSDIKKEIYKAGMFVLTSNYEGMPNALMEAMALGVPCISTDCSIGGPKYLIKNNENGILVKMNDMDDLVLAMTKIINDERFATRISFTASCTMHNYASNSINDKWMKYIKKAIA